MMRKLQIDKKTNALINQAVNEAFNASEWILLSELKAGLSFAGIYLIEINGTKYVVRLCDVTEEYKNIPAEFYAMTIASEKGIAPKVYYSNILTGVLIMEYIKNKTLPIELLWSDSNIQRYSLLLRELHSSKSFMENSNIQARVKFIENLLTPEMRKNKLILSAVKIFVDLNEKVFLEEDIRSCHTDINPNNILFDGNHFKLIDWELAVNTSFYFDLAASIIHLNLSHHDAEETFLTEYFSRHVTSVEREKLEKMKLVVYIYTGLMMLFNSAISQAVLISDKAIESLPSHEEYNKMLAANIVNLNKIATQQSLAFIFLKKAVEQQQLGQT